MHNVDSNSYPKPTVNILFLPQISFHSLGRNIKQACAPPPSLTKVVGIQRKSVPIAIQCTNFKALTEAESVIFLISTPSIK